VLFFLARLKELIKLFTVASVILIFFIIIVLLFTWEEAKVVKDDSNLLEHLLEEELLVAFLTHIRKLHENVVALELIIGGGIINGGVDKRDDGLSISIGVIEKVFRPISENFDLIINDVLEIIASK